MVMGVKYAGSSPCAIPCNASPSAWRIPPDEGEYRVFNQFEETYSIRGTGGNRAAGGVDTGAQSSGVASREPAGGDRTAAALFRTRPRPAPVNSATSPRGTSPAEVGEMLEDLLPHRDRIAQHQQALLPNVHWDGRRDQVGYLAEDGENDWLLAGDAQPVQSVDAPAT